MPASPLSSKAPPPDFLLPQKFHTVFWGLGVQQKKKCFQKTPTLPPRNIHMLSDSCPKLTLSLSLSRLSPALYISLTLPLSHTHCDSVSLQLTQRLLGSSRADHKRRDPHPRNQPSPPSPTPHSLTFFLSQSPFRVSEVVATAGTKTTNYSKTSQITLSTHFQSPQL